jgi:hypothetical protein
MHEITGTLPTPITAGGQPYRIFAALKIPFARPAPYASCLLP